MNPIFVTRVIKVKAKQPFLETAGANFGNISVTSFMNGPHVEFVVPGNSKCLFPFR